MLLRHLICAALCGVLAVGVGWALGLVLWKLLALYTLFGAFGVVLSSVLLAHAADRDRLPPGYARNR